MAKTWLLLALASLAGCFGNGELGPGITEAAPPSREGWVPISETHFIVPRDCVTPDLCATGQLATTIFTVFPNVTADALHLHVSTPTADGFEARWGVYCLEAGCPEAPLAEGAGPLPFDIEVIGMAMSNANLRLRVSATNGPAEKPNPIGFEDLRIDGSAHVRWGPPLIQEVNDYPVSFQTSPCLEGVECNPLTSSHATIRPKGYVTEIQLNLSWESLSPAESELEFWVICEQPCAREFDSDYVSSPATFHAHVEMMGWPLWVGAGAQYGGLVGNAAGSGTQIEGVLRLTELVPAQAS